MQLAQAIKQRAPSLAAAVKDYKGNVAMVNTYVNGVLSSQLPTLTNYPPDWKEFQTAYTDAKTTALKWVNSVLAPLLEVPTDVMNYNTSISALLEDAKDQAWALVDNPSNKAALIGLNSDLTVLTSQLNLVTVFITSAIDNIKSFSGSLPTLGQQLQTIAQKSAVAAKADQALIDLLNQRLTALQQDIQAKTAEIIVLGIIGGAALVLGIVVTIAAWPAGAAIWLILAPVVMTTGVGIALDAMQIQQDKNAIAATQQQMQSTTADVATLSVLATSYSAMASETQQIASALQAILDEWQTLEADVGEAVAEISSAISDTSSADYRAVADDLRDATAEWDAACAQAGSLYVTLEVNNAPLQLGMSADEVQAALAAGQIMDVIAYYNKIA